MLARWAICAWQLCWAPRRAISVNSADRPLVHRRRNPARWNVFGEQGVFLRRGDGKRIRHCEERSDEAIHSLRRPCIASPNLLSGAHLHASVARNDDHRRAAFRASSA
jgi:hypothetical protein